MSTDFNRQAEEFLVSAGFQCEAEPDWIAVGRKPDFFCTGPLDLWIEVKSLARPGESKSLQRIIEYLIRFGGKVDRGRAFAFISDAADEKDAKLALNLAKHALSSFEFTDLANAVIIVPEDPDLSDIININYNGQKGKNILVSYRSISGNYGYPYSARPEPYQQDVILSDITGNLEQRFHQLATPDRFLIALQIDRFDERPFKISMFTRPGLARPLDTSEPIRRAIQNANRQIKNALLYKEAPAVLFLYQQGALVPDDNGLLAALFGDLLFSFTPGYSDDGELSFGNDGALRGKHTSISAIVYFRNEGTPLTVHNPWANRSLPPGVLGEREYLPSNGGILRLIE